MGRRNRSMDMESDFSEGSEFSEAESDGSSAYSYSTSGDSPSSRRRRKRGPSGKSMVPSSVLSMLVGISILGIGVAAILALSKGASNASSLEGSLARTDVDDQQFSYAGNQLQIQPAYIEGLQDAKMMIWRSGPLNFPTFDVEANYPHTLGAIPDFYDVRVRVTSAFNGWAVGDQFQLLQGSVFSGAGGAIAVGVSATEFRIKYGGSTYNGFWSMRIDSGSHVVLYPTDPIGLDIRAWRYV